MLFSGNIKVIHINAPKINFIAHIFQERNFSKNDAERKTLITNKCHVVLLLVRAIDSEEREDVNTTFKSACELLDCEESTEDDQKQ